MDEIPEAFWQGVRQFNRQEFYDCHDTLEAIWINAIASEKNFFQGILQIAVGLHHLRNENWRGAVILIGEGINRLHPYPADYAGIDVDGLIEQASALLKYLQVVGAEQVGETVQQLFGQPQPAGAGGALKLPVIQPLATA